MKNSVLRAEKARYGALRRMDQRRTWIGLGGNIGNVFATFASTRSQLCELAVGQIVASPIYESEPWGITDQPVFFNQVVGLEPRYSPPKTLEALLDIEEAHGRIRGEKWGPRSLDLDLLSWPDLVIESDTLTCPHPRLSERLFVLAPWADVAPELVPFGLSRTVSQLLAACDGSGWVRRCSSSVPVSHSENQA